MQDARPIIPGYDVVRLIGSGGSGAVWAVRRDDGMRLAAKVLPVDEAPEALWGREVIDDHLMPVLDVVRGTLDGEAVTCVLMPLAEGGSLHEVIGARGHLTAGELVTVLVPVARAVHRLHSLGLVHGDLKPSNVLLTADGRPLLADLGAASLPAQTDDQEVWATQLWSAPEVLGGSPPSTASDAFGLGAIAWACATGEAPPPAAMRPGLADSATQLDPGLCDVISACLSHTPSARPDPARFAELVWATAAAQPAPVGLSPGARTAPPPGDPGAELTRRIRAQAAQAATDDAASAPRSRTRRWSTLRAWSGGAAGARGAAARQARHAAAETMPWGRWMVLAGCLIAFVIATGWYLITPEPTGSADPGARPVGVGSTPAAQATPPRSPTSAASSGAASSGPASSHPVDDALTDPAALLQTLLVSRARAWNAVDDTGLNGVFARGSVAWQRDSTDLSTVRARSASYRDVRFDVRSAAVMRSAATSATLRAVIERPACRLVVAGSERVIPAQTSTVDFDLTKTPDGWRIDQWQTT